MDFCHLQRSLALSMVKKFMNKETTAASKSKTAAKRFYQSKCGEILKKEGSRIGKMAGQQI